MSILLEVTMRIHRFLILSVCFLVCFCSAAGAGGKEKLALRLKYNPQDFYVMKGNYSCDISCKAGTAKKMVDREIAFKGSDFTVRDARGSVLVSMSPERAVLYAIQRMAARNYPQGKKYTMSFHWNNLVSISHHVTFDSKVVDSGITYGIFTGGGVIGKHPNLAAPLKYEFSAYYNPQSNVMERVDLKTTGRVHEIPLWYNDYPGFESSVYDIVTEGRLQLLHLNEADGMPMCYTDDAVELGTQYLWGLQDADGSFDKGLSTTTLALLALLKSGVSPEDPRMQRGLDFILNKHDVFDVHDIYKPNIYTQSLLCTYAFANRDWIRSKMDKAGQQRVTDMVEHAANMLVQVYRPLEGGWQDMSRTQYAMMGLFSATASGFWRPEKTFIKKVTDMLLGLQAKQGREIKLIQRRREEREEEEKKKKEDAVETPVSSYASKANTYWNDITEEAFIRGWTYKGTWVSSKNKAKLERQSTPRGSLVCGAISGVCFASEMMLLTGQLTPEYKQKIAISLRDGKAWMQEYFSVEENPNFTKKYTNQLYYLYALERACVMADWQYIGEHDWYQEGALELMRMQIKDGLWKERETKHCPDIAATAFALLFFKKGSLGFKAAVVTTEE